MPVQSLRSRSPPPTTTLAHLHSREQGSERPSGGSRGERTGCSVSRIRHWRKLCCRGRLQNLFWGGVGGRKWFAKMLATAVRRDSSPVMLLYSKEVESRKVEPVAAAVWSRAEKRFRPFGSLFSATQRAIKPAGLVLGWQGFMRQERKRWK